jgi:hypothetical protein
MTHLWTRSSTDDDDAEGGWTPQPLAGAVELGTSSRLQHATTPDGARWVVVGPPSLRVNGEAVPGIAVLADRDAISVDGEHYYFSAESLAEVVPFPVRDRSVLCARCRTEIAPGTAAVACPQCGAWYHQSDALPCRTYAPTCNGCPAATALDAGFRFSPEAL